MAGLNFEKSLSCRPTLSMKTVLTSKATPFLVNESALSANLGKPERWVGNYPVGVTDDMRGEEIRHLSVAVGKDVRCIYSPEVFLEHLGHVPFTTRCLPNGPSRQKLIGNYVFEKRARGPRRCGKVIKTVLRFKPLSHDRMGSVLFPHAGSPVLEIDSRED